MRCLIAAIAAIILTGCTEVPSVPTHALTQRTDLPDGGGTFSVTDSGKYTSSGCGPFGPGHFSFGGSGVGTFIRRNKETGSLSSAKFNCKFSGEATMVSKANQANSISMALESSSLPCYHTAGSWTFTINGGTGRFAQATGSGTVAIRCSIANPGTYTDVWSGTIRF